MVKWLTVAIMLAFAIASYGLEPNRSELSLPLCNEKRVMAHYMTNMAFYRGSKHVTTYFDYENYLPNGPTAFMAGSTQSYPLLDYRKSLGLDAVAEKELKTAKLLGMDGFHFFYPHSPQVFELKYNKTIKAFFRAAERLNIDFKFSLCLCSPNGPESEKQKIQKWGKAIKDILKDTAKSDHWLKTPDGRIIMFLWNNDGLTDAVKYPPETFTAPDKLKYVAGAYAKLADYCGVKFACVYDIRGDQQQDSRFVSAVLDYFPAVWGFVPNPDKGWAKVIQECKRRKRGYVATACPDFYTGKPYRKNTKKVYDRLWRLEDMKKCGVDGMWRRVKPLNLSDYFRRDLELGVKFDADMLNVTTWNDFPEGHQICPDINHNFAYAILLKYYKNIWQGKPGLNNREIGMVFFKKYPHKAKPSLADFEVRDNLTPGKLVRVNEKPLLDEDYIEAVSILEKPARIYVNGRDLGMAPAGISAKRIRIEAGSVSLKAVRDGKTVFSLSTPEWITNAPYRTDRFTFAYSTEFMEYWKKIFGNRKPVVSNEYAEDEKGIPNWKKYLKK